MREGKFQRQVAIVTGISALAERIRGVLLALQKQLPLLGSVDPGRSSPVLAGVAFASVKSRKLATTALPAVSILAGADAAVGFFYHGRGVLRRPGGSTRLLYNIMYGPPIFAPLLFGAAGMLGLLASLLRRRHNEHHSADCNTACVRAIRRIAKRLSPNFSLNIYAGFSTLSQSSFFGCDDTGSGGASEDRPPARTWFSEEAWKFWTVVFEHLIPQTDGSRAADSHHSSAG